MRSTANGVANNQKVSCLIASVSSGVVARGGARGGGGGGGGGQLPPLRDLKIGAPPSTRGANN